MPDSAPCSGAILPLPSRPSWRTGVARYDLHISVLEQRARSHTRPSSVAAAQRPCCDTPRVNHDNSQPMLIASEPGSLPISETALVAKEKFNKPATRHALSRGRLRKVKRSSRTITKSRVETRGQWKQESVRSSEMIEISCAPCAPCSMSSTSGSLDASKPGKTANTNPQAVSSEEAVSSKAGKAKPRVLVIATGGTIAGQGSSRASSAEYQPGVISIDNLVAEIPELNDVAKISTYQICKVGSPDIETTTLVELAQYVQHQLSRNDVDGIVITHGTDTLEETCLFLDLTVLSSKPVILTGSMFPSTSHSADGPRNIYNAVCVGAAPESRDRGVLVVFNSLIMPARSTVKSDANMIHTFDPGHQGSLGQVVDSTPFYYHRAARPLDHKHIDITSLDYNEGLPDVDILYGHLGQRSSKVQRSVEDGYQGIVLAGMGAGSWTHKGMAELERIIGRGRPGISGETDPLIPVVASSRCGRGCVVPGKDIFAIPDWVIRSGFLNPAKSCMLLRVCLAVGMSHKEIKRAFSIGSGLA